MASDAQLNVAMRLKTVRARQGLLWVRAGFTVFFRQPLAFGVLFALFGFGVFLLLQVPAIGPVIALSLMPVATVTFLLATREVLAGRSASPRLIALPLRDPLNRNRLLQLGAAYAATAIAVVLAAHLLDGGRFAAAVEAIAANETTAEGALQDPLLPVSVLLRLGLMALASLAFWHAPALICWGRMPVGKALFASIVACWRARGAFVVYGVAWFALTMLFVTVLQLLSAVLGLQPVIGMAVLPLTMLLSTIFYASLYFSFVDAFEVGTATERAAAPEASGDEPPAAS